MAGPSIKLPIELLSTLGLLGALTAGCGNTEPEQACLDFADALSTAAARCGFDYETHFDQTVELTAGGDCGNIESVRDIDAFDSVCLPYIRQLNCSQLSQTSVELPDECNQQLRR
jgi:hypothetical protein